MTPKKISIRISRPLVTAVLVSMAALIVSSFVFWLLLNVLPFTPEHKVNDFMDMNNQNPVAHDTSYVRGLDQTTTKLDTFLVTPLASIIAGAAFAWFLPKLTWSVSRVIKFSTFLGFATGFLILISGLLLTQWAESLKGAQISEFDPSKLPLALLQSVAYAVPFVIGAWIGATKRKNPQLASATINRSVAQRKTA